MANIELLVPIIEKWEGGYVFDPDDPGGHTIMGVTLKTWQKAGYDKTGDGKIDVDDLRLVTYEEMITVILKPYYWDVWKADHIKNQSIANLLVDWLWCSGPRTVVIVQHMLELEPDGIVGNKTLTAINTYPDLNELHKLIKAARIYYIDAICEQRPVLTKFKRGWKNRIADFVYSPIVLLCLFISMFAGSCRSAKTALMVTVADSIHTTGARDVLSNQQFDSNRSDSTGYKNVLRDKLLETVDMFFSVSSGVDSVPLSGTLQLSGRVHTNRVRELDAVANRHWQQEVKIQHQLADRQEEKTGQSQVKTSTSMSQPAKELPQAQQLIFFIVIILLTAGFFHFSANRKH